MSKHNAEFKSSNYRLGSNHKVEIIDSIHEENSKILIQQKLLSWRMGVFHSKTAKIRGSSHEDKLLGCLEDVTKRIKEEVAEKKIWKAIVQ